jgi:hypothetical protein
MAEKKETTPAVVPAYAPFPTSQPIVETEEGK